MATRFDSSLVRRFLRSATRHHGCGHTRTFATPRPGWLAARSLHRSEARVRAKCWCAAIYRQPCRGGGRCSPVRHVGRGRACCIPPAAKGAAIIPRLLSGGALRPPVGDSMSFAFVFPGQGSQSIGMLAALSKTDPIIRATFEEASAALGYDLWQLTQEGPK